MDSPNSSSQKQCEKSGERGPKKISERRSRCQNNAAGSMGEESCWEVQQAEVPKSRAWCIILMCRLHSRESLYTLQGPFQRARADSIPTLLWTISESGQRFTLGMNSGGHSGDLCTWGSWWKCTEINAKNLDSWLPQWMNTRARRFWCTTENASL